MNNSNLKSLDTLVDLLSKRKDLFEGDYFIPKIWNSFEYKKYSISDTRKNQINVNPYQFTLECITQNIIKSAKCDEYMVGQKKDLIKNSDTDSSILQDQELNTSKISKSVIYSILPRMFTAWDHYEPEEICGGTFVKLIYMLPYIKKMNVDIVYLLPIFSCSEKYKKGELSSPYAIKNIYKLDSKLHDPLLGEETPELLNLQFKSFMEACKLMGIRVIVDFVFRTCARDNDLIADHPDWFYWIDKKYDEKFCPIRLKCGKDHIMTTLESAEMLYSSECIQSYVNQFSYDPRIIDPLKWEHVIKNYNDANRNILDVIDEKYNITTVPGFSDVINDSQPQWSDVTFLKMCFDDTQVSKKYIKEEKPAHILHDGIKCNLFLGNYVNTELYEYIINIIPYYQQEFGIDGARIDMGHALPCELIDCIIKKVKQENPDFILWSEEFDPAKSNLFKEQGFEFISGAMWSVYPRLGNLDFADKWLKSSIDSAIPVVAAVETPDTPRALRVLKNLHKVKLAILLNSFVPNSVVLINNGLELGEIQPMNLGLGGDKRGKYVLPKEDRMYGKLAFFDQYQLHWINNDVEVIYEFMCEIHKIRKKFGSILCRKENFTGTVLKKCIILFYHLPHKDSEEKYENIFVIANTSKSESIQISFKDIINEKLYCEGESITFFYDNGSFAVREQKKEVKTIIKSLDAVIGVIH